MDRAEKLEALIDGAEELLTNLTDAHDPDIQKLRDQVDHAIADTRRAIARGQDDGTAWLREVAGIVNDYVRDYPWLALTTGVLIAGCVAFLAGSVVTANKHSMGD